jgi:hypothetical protein
MLRYAAELGEPDVSLGELQLWVHSHEKEGNWLTVTAHCGAKRASVWVSGEILRLTDLAQFGEQCAELQVGNARSAELSSLEPNLRVELRPPGRRGEIKMIVEITPDEWTQKHRFKAEINLSYLARLRQELHQISGRYRGE